MVYLFMEKRSTFIKSLLFSKLKFHPIIDQKKIKILLFIKCGNYLKIIKMTVLIK